MHWPRKAGIEGKHRVAEDILGLTTELAPDDLGKFFAIKFIHGAQHPENEDVLASVFGRAANGFDGSGGERHTDMDDIALHFQLFNLVAVVKTDTSVAQGFQMIVVGILVERHQRICLVTGMEHLTRTQMNLVNTGPSGNRGRNRHVGHDVLCGGSCELGKECADRLDSVLRISG